MVNKHRQRRQNFADHVDRRWRIFVTAEVHHDPCDVPEERQRNVWVDEGDERLDDTEADDIVAALWSITCAAMSQQPRVFVIC